MSFSSTLVFRDSQYILRAAALSLLVAGCSSSSGPVSVHVDDPRDGGFVIFQDDVGTRRISLDAQGNASNTIIAGGSVTAVTEDGEARAAAMYTDVHPGDSLEFGIPPPLALDAEVTIDAALRPGTDAFVYASACGSGVVDPAHVAHLSSTCAATDLVVIACKLSSGVGVVLRSPVACDSVGGWVSKPVQLGAQASVTVADGDWRDLLAIGIEFDPVGRNVELAGPIDMTSAWGVSARGNSPTFEDGTEAFLPAAGPKHLKGVVTQVNAGRAQDFNVSLPDGTHRVELSEVLAPWVTDTVNAWTSDDVQGALVAHALVTSYASGANTLDIYQAPTAAGDYTAPPLPAALAALISDEALHLGVPRLVRTDGADFSVGAQRLANIVVSGGDPGGISYAITEWSAP